jgi:hypothetical protein
MSEGFFDRWSRRKQQVRAGEVPQEPLPPEPLNPPNPSNPSNPPPAAEADAPAVEAPPPAPTLADVRALRLDADFRPFVARDVAPEVRNAAFRKLFSDPHFNVMDGMDIYIDDYAKPSPLSAGALRQMAGAKFLKLFDEETPRPEGTPARGGAPDVAQSADPEPEPASATTDDHETDLRLQPDDAPGADDARGRAG